MPATWESQATDPTTSSADTSMVVTKPTGLAVGDLLLGIGQCVTSRTISAPGGWTVVANDSSTMRVYIWTKIADSSDVAASNFTFTASGSFSQAIVTLHRVSSPSTNTPTFSIGSAVNSSSQSCPTISTPTNNCLVFWGCTNSNGGQTSTADKGTERTDTGNASSGCWIGVYTNLEATAGSITGATITLSTSQTSRPFSIAIESAATASGNSIYYRQQQALAI